MKRITDFIVKNRNFVIILFIIFSIISVFLSQKVKVNYDMTEYMPSNSETRIGLDIMNEEFEEENSSILNVMFKNLEENEKDEIYEKLSDIKGVSSIDYEKDSIDYNKDENTLYILNVDELEDSETAKSVYDFVIDNFKDYEFYTSGSISERNQEILPLWIIIVAVSICALILIIMCESYIEPFLFLTCIGIAILLNNGTNLVFGTVSNITSSISAILQLALSMDYSIMLISRYQQEKEHAPNKVEAMKEALYRSFGSISSSSVTTIVGLVTLVFMSFTIGRDLGLVLAKGVVFSLLVIFTCLPALILMFDKLIVKTKKKTPNIKLDWLGNFAYKFRSLGFAVLIVLFIGSYILKGNLGILYTNSEVDKVGEVFPPNNQIAIIYKNEDEEKVASLLGNLENQDKVSEVLGYGNTINQKLTYDKLCEKLNDLGEEIDIEDYLLKILYYNYYNQSENNKMTFNQFVNFIQTEVYNNDKMNDELDEDMKSNIDRLGNFTTEKSMNKLRTSNEIAEILEIDPKEVKDVFIYNSKNNDLKLGVQEFIDFINKKVLTDSEYADQIDKKSRDDLNTLSKYTNKSTNNKKMSSNEMASLFGMDVSSMDSLYKYYISLSDVSTTKMTISEFANFVLNNMLTDAQYAGNFDEATISSIKTLANFSNKENITKQMTSTELSTVFGLDENMVKQLLLLKYTAVDCGNTMSISEFINYVIVLKNNTNYLDGVDLSNLETLAVFAKNENNINTTKMNEQQLAGIFDGIRAGFVENIYLFANLPSEYQMTPQEFVNLVLQQLGNNSEDAEDTGVFSLDDTTLNKLKLLKLVIDDSVSTNKTQYTVSKMSALLGLNKSQVTQLYGLIAFTQGKTDTWTASMNEFVNSILSNMSNPEISNSINEATLAQLNLLSNIMNSSLNNIKYNYSELSASIGIEESKLKSIYTLYKVSYSTVQLTPNEFVNFILEHRNDSALSGSLSSDKIKDLQLVQSVMNGVSVGQKYSNSELSDLLGIDKSKIELLYGLYITKNINPNQTMSLRNIVSFLLSDVLTNPDYSSKFDDEKTEKLNTINGIMNATINNTKYTKDEIFTILAVLTDTLDKNMVDLLYVYYGSNNEYNVEWTMTIQDFVKFLNENILNDERFEDFIDDEMRQNIIDAKETVSDAKKLLIGKSHSRIVLNTKLPSEGEETYNFLQKIYDDFDGLELYVIGNSPMAYEMSKTFESEFNKISVLTMISIFIVVAVTFKSIAIPLLLVLIIQCAVYMTMGILSLLGGEIYFIAILIVQSILMGATIDYAILYTSYYKESRAKMSVKEAVINGYNKSIHTILTSSSILIIATFLVGKFATAIVSKICITLAQGVLCSTILILLVLPEVLSLFDRFFIRVSKNK